MEREREKERKTIYTVLVNGEIIDVTTDCYEVGRIVEHAINMRLSLGKDDNIDVKIETWTVLI